MALPFSVNIEHWQIERLIPHARNARTHSEEQVAQIAGSIAEFGFVNPVLIGDDGVMVAGHGRVMAARQLGLSEVPVIVLSHLTPTQRRALMIADNQIATNAGWNQEMLAAELAALKEEDFDLDLLGFDDAEIDRLLADASDDAGNADEAPARLEWQKLRERNEALDCRVYARAAAWIAGADRWTEAMWRDLEQQVNVSEGSEGEQTTEMEMSSAGIAGLVRRRPEPRGRRVFRSSYMS
jgi:ParB-like chromosome segregation protein Spo0J